MSRDDQRRRSGREALLWISMVIEALLLAFALLANSDDPGDAPGRGASSGSAVTVTATEARSPSRQTAVVAAVEMATAPQQWLYLTDDEVESAVREVSAPRRADDLTNSVVEDIRDAREGLSESSGPVWWIVRPLAVQVGDLSDDRATVEVWVVTVLSAREVAAPQAEWRTIGLDLVWIRGDWKVDAVRDSPGPTPMVGPGDRPWDAVPFDAALEGFERLDGEVVR